MQVSESHLVALNIPTDIIAAAKQIGLDFKALLVLLMTHTQDEIRMILQNLLGKLPVTSA